MTPSRLSAKRLLPALRAWLFPLCVVCLYGMGFFLAPAATGRAMDIAGSMSVQLVFPLCFALTMMVVLNRFISPSAISRFLGKGTGIRGILLSSLAGVLSMGPIYAWYPVFKTVREGGASTFIVANFIGCRSVKPVLFPVLIAYFGWAFSLLFLAFSLIGALLVAWVVSLACPVPEATGEGGPPR